MSNGRASIFDSDSAPDFDVTGFEPRKPAAAPKPDKKSIREAAEQRGFGSREPEPAKPAAAAPVQVAAPASIVTPPAELSARPVRRSRQHITGRNKQFNVKATEATIDRFYSISDAQNWVLGETLEHALAALEEKLAKK